MTNKEYAFAAAARAVEASVAAGEPGWANFARWDQAYWAAKAECAADDARCASYDDAETFGREVAQ